MLPTDRIPTHPGEMLVEEFLKPRGIAQIAFAAHLRIPIQRVNEVANGKRGVTPETAILFGAALGTTPEFWMNLQTTHDLALARAALPRIPAALASAGGARRSRVRRGSHPAKRFAVAAKKKR